MYTGAAGSCAIIFHVRDVYWTEKFDYFSASAAIMYVTFWLGFWPVV